MDNSEIFVLHVFFILLGEKEKKKEKEEKYYKAETGLQIEK